MEATMKNIIIDFDSTLVTIEGIDELARKKGVFTHVKKLTDLAMNGQISLDKVFAQRLDYIKPTRCDIEQLSQMYLEHITLGAKEFITTLQEKFDVFVVTGGYESAVLPTTRTLGIPDDHVYANKLLFSEEGDYLGFDTAIPLWKQNGKETIVKEIQLLRRCETIIIGDGMSDAEAKTNGEIFVQFTGVVNRPAVAEKAQVCIDVLQIGRLQHILNV